MSKYSPAVSQFVEIIMGMDPVQLALLVQSQAGPGVLLSVEGAAGLQEILRNGVTTPTKSTAKTRSSTPTKPAKASKPKRMVDHAADRALFKEELKKVMAWGKGQGKGDGTFVPVPFVLNKWGGCPKFREMPVNVRAAIMHALVDAGEIVIEPDGDREFIRFVEGAKPSKSTTSSATKTNGLVDHLRATLAVIACVFTLIPTMTVSVTGGIGPILASIALPEILSVQEMAGAAEVLRAYRMEADETITPSVAGAALQDVGFVGSGGTAEPWEQPPTTVYEEGWFPEADFFPDPFSETVATDLIATPFDDFTPEEQAALRQAAAHPAHEAFHLLARARLVDVVSGRWTLPFPDSVSFASLPWPRFAAFRTAGLAHHCSMVSQLALINSAAASGEAKNMLFRLRASKTGLALQDRPQVSSSHMQMVGTFAAMAMLSVVPG